MRNEEESENVTLKLVWQYIYQWKYVRKVVAIVNVKPIVAINPWEN